MLQGCINNLTFGDAQLGYSKSSVGVRGRGNTGTAAAESTPTWPRPALPIPRSLSAVIRYLPSHAAATLAAASAIDPWHHADYDSRLHMFRRSPFMYLFISQLDVFYEDTVLHFLVAKLKVSCLVGGGCSLHPIMGIVN